MSQTQLKDGGYLTVGSDITDLKAQSELADRLKNSIDEVPMRFALWDSDGSLFHSNKFTKERINILGYEFVEGNTTFKEYNEFLIKNQVIKRINDKDIAEYIEIDNNGNEKLNMPEVREVEFFNGNYALHRDVKLADSSIVTFGDDITEIKNREKELSVIRNAVENSPIRILMADNDDNFTFINNSARENFKKFGIEVEIGESR